MLGPQTIGLSLLLLRQSKVSLRRASARLFQGALVIVSAYPEVTVPDCMLSDMLRTTAHWQALPPSPHFRVPSVWVLTDAEPFRLEFAPGQSDIRSSQVAAMAGYDPHSIALCVAAPPLSDHSRWGWHTLTVAVASQHFERRRHPQEGPFVVFIDQRPAMLGVGWRLFPGPLFPLQAFVDGYANTCPAHLSVAVSGSETVDMPEGTCLRIRDGLTLIVEYVYIWHPDPGDEDVSVASSAPTSFPGGDTDTDSSNPSEDGDAEPGPDPLSEGSTPATGGSFCGAHHQVSLLTAVVCSHLAQPARAVDLGVGHRPISVGDRLFTVPREPHQPLVARLGLLSAFPALYTTQYKLLCEPACSSLAGNQRLQAARTGTLRLGLAWPFQPAGPHPLEAEEETGSSSETDSVDVLIDISCLILVPDHEPERVTFEVQIPAAPAHAIATANHCRSGPNCDLFPGLQPVWPQPDARWAVLLALPEWEHAGPLICLDLYAVDGRIFAVSAPDYVCIRFLLSEAGLPDHSRVRIYYENEPLPLPPGRRVPVRNGMCFSFVPPGVRQEALFSFAGLLESHLSWDAPPAFPRAATEDCYCVVTGLISCPFIHLPARDRLLLLDLGELLQIHHTELSLIFAEPRPRDAWSHGYPCHTVVAARRHTPDQLCPVLLDARAILRGWCSFVTAAGVFGLERLDALLGPPPQDFAYDFFPEPYPDGQWRFRPGQILIVYMRRVPGRAGGARGTGIHHNAATGTPPFVPVPLLTPGQADSNVRSRSAAAGPTAGRRVGAFNRAHAVMLLALAAAITLASAALPASIPLAGAPGPAPAFLLLLHAYARGQGRGGSLFVVPGVTCILCACALGCLPIALATPVGQSGPDLAPVVADGWHVEEKGATGAIATLYDWPQEPAGRPVPTPCRSISGLRGLLAPAVFDTEPAGPLQTLLEESLHAASGHPYFLAATLLETLEEHFESIPVSSAVQYAISNDSSHNARSPTLRLFGRPELITVHDLTHVSLPLPRGLHDTAALFKPDSWRLPQGVPADLPSHPAARQLLAHCLAGPTLSGEVWDHIHIFTDGSFDGSRSSWAFCVLALLGPDLHFLGWAGDHVVTDAADPVYLGASEHSALHGEQSALAWAAFWALQAPPCRALGFSSDCETAIGQVTGRCGWAGTAELAAAGRHIMQVLASGRPEFQGDVRHVRSHQGQPANELVDGLAKYVCRQRRGSPDPHQLLLTSWHRSGALPWAWLLVESVLRPSLWPQLCGFSFVDQDRHTDQDPLSSEECAHIFGLETPGPETAHPSPVWARFLLVTVNVQSLSDGDKAPVDASDTAFPGRAAYLREQLAALRVHVASLQETRASVDATITSRSHVRLCRQGRWG